MKYIILSKTNEDFEDQQTSNRTLPLVVMNNENSELYFQSAESIESKLDSNLDGEEGSETEETDYIKQINKILDEDENPS